MSVAEGLDELVGWLADRLAKDEPGAPEPLTRETWGNVHRNLKNASEALRTLTGVSSVNRELARDVAREAGDLALRAHVLAARSPKKESMPKPEHATREHQERIAPPHSTAAAQQADGGEHPPDEKEKPLPERLAAIQRTLEAACRDLLADRPLEADAKAFANQLDVVLEMMLLLREQVGVT